MIVEVLLNFKYFIIHVVNPDEQNFFVNAVNNLSLTLYLYTVKICLSLLVRFSSISLSGLKLIIKRAILVRNNKKMKQVNVHNFNEMKMLLNNNYGTV